MQGRARSWMLSGDGSLLVASMAHNRWCACIGAGPRLQRHLLRRGPAGEPWVDGARVRLHLHSGSWQYMV